MENVFPKPVGAFTNPLSPRPMAFQACSWNGKGDRPWECSQSVMTWYPLAGAREGSAFIFDFDFSKAANYFSYDLCYSEQVFCRGIYRCSTLRCPNCVAIFFSR
jgi:hypothetical protein